MKQTYPVILHPMPGTAVVQPTKVRGGKNKKKGASELVSMARGSDAASRTSVKMCASA